MQTIREFAPADRYVYDFGPCSYDNGFAQIDTPQDASYYGNWCSPSRRIFVSYCEGDVVTHICETDAEFLAHMDSMDAWNRENQGDRIRIDPGLGDAVRAALVAIGAARFMHDA